MHWKGDMKVIDVSMRMEITSEIKQLHRVIILKQKLLIC